jgi:parvulin-like peptidyl-prolyl isomerase
MKRIWLVAAVVGVACLCGCASAPSGTAPEKAQPVAEESKAPLQAETVTKGEVLARVGDTVITDTMLEDKINSMTRSKARFKSPKAKKELLNSLVELEMVYQEALREGLDKDQETLDRLEEYRKRVVATRLREKILEEVEVSNRDIKAEYKEQSDRFKIPKKVRVSQIVFAVDKNASKKDIEAVKKNARDILARAKKGEDFAALAKKYSFDKPSADKGGDIGYANKKRLPRNAYDAAMSFERVGDISDLIEGKNDIRILTATEVVPESKKSLEEVRSWLERMAKRKKQREAWQNYMEDMKKKSGVEVFEDKIVAVEESSPEKEE